MNDFNILDYLQNTDDNANEISGYYKYTVHKNQQTGFTVFTLKTDENTVVCVGKIQSLNSLYNIPITLKGCYINDEKYGRQFVFNDYSLSCSEKAEIISLLKSGLIKGLRFSTACSLADKVVENNISDLLPYFENASTYANLVYLIPEFKKYEFEILQKISKIIVSEKLFKLIIEAGGEYVNVLKLITNYDNAYTLIKNNVYKTGFYIGLNYQTCDYLAKKFNYSDYDKKRAEGILFFALNQIEENGSTCTSLPILKKIIESLQKRNSLKYLPFEYVASYLINNKIIKYDIQNNTTKIYFSKTRMKEQILATNIRRIEAAKEQLDFNETIITELEQKLGISYAPEQRKAFNVLKSTGVKIVTGGPGTGKTTWVNGFINAYKKMFPNNIIKLCSPTGRAAQRMSESTGCFAETFHRLLEYKPFDGGVCKYSSTNRYDCDCLIIDEMSMADLAMTSFIFDALKNNVTVIILGDIDQLPSVGCGNILNDLIDSNFIEVHRLKTVFRQNGISSIVSNAIKINNCESDLICDNSFNIINVDDDLTAMTLLNDYIDDNCQIFSPTKKGFLGTGLINRYIQSQIRTINNNEEYVSYGINHYYKGDKIMVVKNNYDKGYFNGEVGIITDISKLGIEIKFEDGRIVSILNSMLDEITLAYAITVHKSQGSEYKNIVIILSDDASSLLNKKILYTAVTRAKNNVIIINRNNGLSKCLANNINDERMTFLKDLLLSA